MPMQGNVLKIVTASTGPDNVTSVVHDELTVGQSIPTLLFALTGQDELHPAGPDTVIGEVLVDESDRIVVRQANLRHGGGWDYEFRGTARDLELLHRTVAVFEQRVERARELAAAQAVLGWRPTPAELEAAGPTLSGIER